MDFFLGMLSGGMICIFAMSAMFCAKKADDYDRGFIEGFKKGVTDLEPFVRDLQLREWVARVEETQQ